MPYSEKAKYCHIKFHEPKDFKKVKVTKGPNAGKIRQFYTTKATSERFQSLYTGKKYQKFFKDKKYKAFITYGKLKETGDLAIQRLLVPNEFCKPDCDPRGECFAPEYKKSKKSQK